MRRIAAALLVCGISAVLTACGPSEEPSPAPAAEPTAAETPGEKADPPMGSFEAGDTRGWDTAKGDDSRTDFESGDVSAWSDTQGSLGKSGPPREAKKKKKEKKDEDG